jgi:hypothetical protein
MAKSDDDSVGYKEPTKGGQFVKGIGGVPMAVGGRTERAERSMNGMEGLRPHHRIYHDLCAIVGWLFQLNLVSEMIPVKNGYYCD